MKSSLTDTHPELAAYWNSEKNKMNLDAVTSGSGSLAWWVCSRGHEWEARVYNMAHKTDNFCPVCNGQKVLAGFNDLATTHPEIANQWAKENTKAPDQVSAGASYKATWSCNKGHYWITPVFQRTRKEKTGCPYCSGRIAIPGVNDLATIAPLLMKQWHPTKNKNLLPETLKPYSNKKVWWRGECHHEWETTPANRMAGKNCPYCTGRKVEPDLTSFKACHPELVKFWVTTNKVQPDSITSGSHAKITWEQACGHKFVRPVKAFIASQACPYCSGMKALPGFNDLFTQHPRLEKEWHPTLNQNINAKDVRAGSDLYAWWQCEKKHEWKAQIKNRLRTGCPTCSLSKNTSQGEDDLTNFIRTLFPNAQADRNLISPYHLDCYVPERKVAIEFNGLYWHSEKIRPEKDYHYKKWAACKDKGIQLIQIWEDDWNRNPELVKRILAYKLGVSSLERVYARSTKLVEVSKDDAHRFLSENHIQGSVAGGVRVGLKTYEGNLVAVMLLKNENNSLNLLRYATSQAVTGGFTKLLKHVEDTHNPDSIVTFSDNTISDGGLYEKNGFQLAKEVAPDYMYISGSQRRHKFGYRLKRFRNDTNLQYIEGYSERQLAELNKLNRIWDAGKIKWVKPLEKPILS